MRNDEQKAEEANHKPKTTNHKPPMAINKNHEFEELDGIKCSIVEKNATAERVEFLKKLLEFNRYTVVVIPTPAAKVAVPPKPAVAPTDVPPQTETPTITDDLPKPPETFTIGVTDVSFNPTNAIFGRLLHTPDRHIVTLAYWQQKESVSQDEIPYFQK
jgi:hypothetical protein